jgi:2-dehydropantoate 2-reductase
MKIAILGGAGAMGSVFGACLTRGGHDVYLIDVSSTAVDKITAEGLTILDKSGEPHVVRIKATTDPTSVGAVDLIITFVKCYHTEMAIKSALPMVGDTTVVMSLQNGWGNGQAIAAIVGPERVIVGVTYYSASLLEPGVVRQNAAGATHIGELDGKLTERLAAIASGFTESGMEIHQSKQITNDIWAKLALNICTLPTSALLRFSSGELPKHAGTVAIMRELLRETVLVARAQGIHLDESERWDSIISVLNRAGAGKSSMLQDVENKRRTEIDVINGAIIAASKKTNIDVPCNQTMVHLIKALEETF